MSRIRRTRTLPVLAAGAAVALATAATGWATSRGPEKIPLPNGWQPEGIASGPGDQLFVGSIPTGRIIKIDPRTGRSRIVVPQRDGRAATGLKVQGRTIFTAGASTGRAFVYDAKTGADIANVSLTSDPAFINDVTLTRDAAWFTDSVNPRLYKLDRRTNTATPLALTGDLQYDADPATFEANGIAAADGGRSLLVVQSRTGGLFRVDPATGASKQVPLTGGTGGALPNADGILLKGRTLYVVQNRLNKIAVVKLARDLSAGTITGELTDPDFQVPTTIAKARGALFAVNARFGTPPTPETTYDVVRVGKAKAGRDGHGKGHDDDRRGRGRGGDDD